MNDRKHLLLALLILARIRTQPENHWSEHRKKRKHLLLDMKLQFQSWVGSFTLSISFPTLAQLKIAGHFWVSLFHLAKRRKRIVILKMLSQSTWPGVLLFTNLVGKAKPSYYETGLDPTGRCWTSSSMLPSGRYWEEHCSDSPNVLLVGSMLLLSGFVFLQDAKLNGMLLHGMPGNSLRQNSGLRKGDLLS